MRMFLHAYVNSIEIVYQKWNVEITKLNVLSLIVDTLNMIDWMIFFKKYNC